MKKTQSQSQQQRRRKQRPPQRTAVEAVFSAVAGLTFFAGVTAALVLSHSLTTTSRTTPLPRCLTSSPSSSTPQSAPTSSSLMQLSMAPTTQQPPPTPTPPLQDEFDYVPTTAGLTSRETTSKTTRGQAELGTPLRMICDEQREFEMNLGKAVDTLKHDYPYILTEQPDFSIYADDMEIVDPSGVTLHRLSNYKNFFRLIHFLVNTIYCPDRSGLTFRLLYDCTRNNIRVHWNAYVIPKAIFGGTKTTLHVDGISVYEICRASGKITQHRVEHLLINDIPIKPAEGIFHALRSEVDPEFIPVFNVEGGDRGNVVHFQPLVRLPGTSAPLSLFAMSSSATSTEEDKNGQGAVAQTVDWAALERKNASRKKFGMAPLTPEEFVQLEAKVQQMDHQRRQAAALSAAEMSKKKDETDDNIFKKLFGEVLESTCESNYDCERPLVCCDFGFKKTCCYSGARVVEGQPALIRVPVETGYPPQGGGRGPTNRF